jgi:3'(2'), 5'-bisphosphate nucleotidase
VQTSRSYDNAKALWRLLGGQPVRAIFTAGSSLELCLLAAGEADLYPRPGRTMEWDIAAGDAVLRAAGGEIRQLDR